MIDLYINLPSSNQYRRPANYVSQGYRTRRLAVDYQTPLVTNVKNAKILVEALARKYDFGIQTIDYQNSHRVLTIPGLINVAAFIPGLAIPGSSDFEAVTQASIAAGFSMIRIMPLGLEASLTDLIWLKAAQENGSQGAFCDYNYSFAAGQDNADIINKVTGEVGSLFIPFNHLCENICKVATIESHFAAWPESKPIVTDAKTTDLASVLLLASLHSRKLHVTSVSTKDDIKLIALSKSKGLKVTCDVSVYSLFLTREEYPECRFLPNAEDQRAIWDHMDTIDIFSVGSIPFQVTFECKKETHPAVGIADTLPLLLTAASEGRLTIEDIVKRLHDKPKEIFELHEQANTSIELEVDRPYVMQASTIWSPSVGKKLRGSGG